MSGIAGYTTVHAAGIDNDASWHAIAAGRSGLTPNDLSWCDLPCWIGQVREVDQTRLPADLAAWDCRVHRLIWIALQRNGFRSAVANAVACHGAHRVGLVLGSSTAGIRSTEIAYAQRLADGRWPADFDYRKTHSLDALCRFSAEVLGLQGPMVTISTACSSSAKAFVTARRWIDCGLIDAAVVGGADSLCLSTLHGFDSLQLLSGEICRPFDASRSGISIGEAAGFVLLEREAAAINFCAGGESSDAWHMSAPHPEGLGAQQAMQQALQAAALAPSDIGYVCAHGTATLANDRAEAAAMRAVFGADAVAVSSIKGVTGHTLGAAGILEAAVALLAIEHGLVPGNLGGESPDPQCGASFAWRNEQQRIDVALSNSFGFGGNNACLAFARAGFRA